MQKRFGVVEGLTKIGVPLEKAEIVYNTWLQIMENQFYKTPTGELVTMDRVGIIDDKIPKSYIDFLEAEGIQNSGLVRNTIIKNHYGIKS